MGAGMTVGQEAGVLASRCDVKSGLELILSALGPNGSCSHPASPTFCTTSHLGSSLPWMGAERDYWHQREGKVGSLHIPALTFIPLPGSLPGRGRAGQASLTSESCGPPGWCALDRLGAMSSPRSRGAFAASEKG